MLPFLNLIASSGIEINDFVEYLKAGATAVGIGKSLYANASDYNEITENAKTVRKKLKEYFESIEKQV
jgi:2-keto-3-deoxy-6-phosphogluconate aldolase